MKKYFIFALAMLIAMPMMAGKPRHAAVFDDPQSYSCVFINVATAGTKNIKVSGIAKNKDAAIERAGMNAVHTAIFNGIPGGNNGQPTPSLYGSPAPAPEHQQYFDNFFNQGQYKMFLTQVSAPSGKDMSEVKGGVQVKVEIQVRFDELRKKLINDGIIKGLTDAIGSAQKPVIMIFPDEDWCKSHRYTMADDANTVDYNKALSDVNMKDLINEFTNFMVNVCGYECEDLAATLKDFRNEKAWGMADAVDDGEDKAGGARELLASAANADFCIEFYPELRQDAGKQYVIFRIKAVDASTNKAFYTMSAQGTSTYGSGQMVNQLKEAVLNIKDEFIGALQKKFGNMAKNGREIRLLIQRKETCPVNFAKKYDGDPLSSWIEDWLNAKVQTPGFTSGKNTANRLEYKQVMIPLMKEKKNRVTKRTELRAQSAKDFANELADFITETTNLPCRVDSRSMGKAVITLGQDDSEMDE